METVLITGGTGLIGRALSRRLVENGYQVVVLTRNVDRAKQIFADRVDVVQWDYQRADDVVEQVERAGIIVNLAGESIAGETTGAILTKRWSNAQKQRILQSRVNVGNQLAEAIRIASTKPRVFIQASAIGYYGPSSDDTLDELSPAGSDFLAQVCQAWEESTQAIEALGVRRVIIRTGLVLAKDGGILPLMLLPVKLFVGGALGSGKQYLPWIHMDDEIESIMYLIENNTLSGPFNLVAPTPVRQIDFVRTAGKLLNRPAFLPVPAFVLRLVLGEKATLVLDGQNAVPKRLLEAGFRFNYPELESALQSLL